MTNEQQQQNRSNNNIKNKKINLYTYLVQFSLKRQITVRHILLRCTHPAEASGGQGWTTSGQLDIYSQMSGQLDIYSQTDIPSSDVPP